MFTAASLMISASGCEGTSMTKQWLMRRAVRMPVSRATTAPISSSVCRLPFISASARPQRTSSTALAAESWLCAEATMLERRDVEPGALGDVADPRRRSDQDRLQQAQPGRFHRALERDRIAGMRDRVAIAGCSVATWIRRSYFS